MRDVFVAADAHLKFMASLAANPKRMYYAARRSADEGPDAKMPMKKNS